MSITNEFFKSESFFNRDIEDQIIFIIDNYTELMRIYRCIDRQNKQTKAKKEEAHRQLQILRDHIEELQKSKRKLSEQEKLAIEEKQNFLNEMREEDDIVFYKGVPLNYDQLTEIIIKFQSVLPVIDSLDHKVRQAISPVCKFGVKALLFPIRKALSFSIYCYEPGEFSNFLTMVKDSVDIIPDIVENKILNGD